MSELRQQVNINVEAVKKLMTLDLDFVGGFVSPETCSKAFPDFYKEMFREVLGLLLKTEDFSKLAIGFPRGHGKTIWVKFVIFTALTCTDIGFVLVNCVAENKAKDILRDVWRMFDRQNVQALFGNLKLDVDKDTETHKQLMIGGKPKVLVGAGWGGAVRGFNIDEMRPELMIFDDAQSKECAKSAVEAKNFQDWFYSTALKAKSPNRCTFIYVGNMYPDLIIANENTPTPVYACLLRNLQLNSHWKSYIVGAILADGTALWEELQPLTQLLEEYEHDKESGYEEIFMSEVMNDPTATYKNKFPIENIKSWPKLAGELHQGNFIILDPATNKKKADDIVATYFEVFDSKPKVMEIHSDSWSAPALVQYCLRLAIEKQCNLIAIESEAFQYTLIQWFDFFKKLLNISQDIKFVPIYSGGISKNSRIITMIRSLISQDLRLTDLTYAPVIDQIKKFNPAKTNNTDDILDTLAYADKVMLDYGHELIIEGSAMEIHANFEELPSPDSFAAGF